jgi:hypothetical protein
MVREVANAYFQLWFPLMPFNEDPAVFSFVELLQSVEDCSCVFIYSNTVSLSQQMSSEYWSLFLFDVTVIYIKHKIIQGKRNNTTEREPFKIHSFE